VCSSRRKRRLSRSIRGERLGGQSALFIPSSAPYLLFISFFSRLSYLLVASVRCRCRYPMTEPSQSQRTDSGLTISLDTESTWVPWKRDWRYAMDSKRLASTNPTTRLIVINSRGFVTAMDEPCYHAFIILIPRGFYLDSIRWFLCNSINSIQYLCLFSRDMYSPLLRTVSVQLSRRFIAETTILPSYFLVRSLTMTFMS